MLSKSKINSEPEDNRETIIDETDDVLQIFLKYGLDHSDLDIKMSDKIFKDIIRRLVILEKKSKKK